MSLTELPESSKSLELHENLDGFVVGYVEENSCRDGIETSFWLNGEELEKAIVQTGSISDRIPIHPENSLSSLGGTQSTDHLSVSPCSYGHRDVECEITRLSHTTPQELEQRV